MVTLGTLGDRPCIVTLLSNLIGNWRTLGSELTFSGFHFFEDVAEVVGVHIKMLCDVFEGEFIFPVGYTDRVVSVVF